jgi:serine/threonine-protein kinase
MLRQACESLAEAHASGLIHRDIKPANLFACSLAFEVDFIKVLDFGMVRAEDNSGESSLTADGAIGGTPAFFAPELALGDKIADHRCDLYSLGCVGYFLLTGELVFEGDTPVKVLMAHLHEKPVPPSARTDHEVPAELDEVILACLAKDPDERPQSALELVERIDSLACAGDWSVQRAREWWELHLRDYFTVGDTSPTAQ